MKTPDNPTNWHFTVCLLSVNSACLFNPKVYSHCATHVDVVTTESCIKSKRKPSCGTSTHNNLFLLNIQHRHSGVGGCLIKGSYTK